MKPILTLFIALFLLSCARPHYLTQSQVNDTTVHMEPFDTLTAYRKAPGAPKTVEVKGYTRKDGKKVAAHQRSPKGS